MKQAIVLPDKFMSYSDLYDINKTLHDKMWKEYLKNDFEQIRNDLAINDQFEDFAEERTGLEFSDINVHRQQKGGRNETIMDITLSDTGKQDLGFFGNYINAVRYNFYSSGSPHYNPKTKEFIIFFNTGIGYDHKDGGHNGVSEKDWRVAYNITTKTLSFSKWSDEQ